MAENGLTTIQIDVETREKLKTLAAAFERTSAGQLRWLVNQEYQKWESVKLLPQGEAKEQASAKGE